MPPTPCTVEKMLREQLENLCWIQCKHSTVRTSCDVDLTLSPKTPKSEHHRGVCQGETKSTEHQPRDWKGFCFLGPPWAASNTPTPSSGEKMRHKERPCAKSGVGQGLGGDIPGNGFGTNGARALESLMPPPLIQSISPKRPRANSSEPGAWGSRAKVSL